MKREVILNQFRNFKMNERLCLWTLFSIKHGSCADMSVYMLHKTPPHRFALSSRKTDHIQMHKGLKEQKINLYKLSMSQQKGNILSEPE